MESSKNIKKKTTRFKSVTNTFDHKLFQFERSNSNSNFSSISKKTGAFEENILGGTIKMNSFSTKISPNNLYFSIKNNLNIHSSVDLSIKDLKEKTDINNIYTNINISIDNPNFSINNIENNNNKNNTNTNTNTNINNKSSINEINNHTLISFKGSNIDSQSSETNTDNNKVISSMYADYLANKSSGEIFSENMVHESKINKLNEFLDKNKILQYEYNKGCFAGFSAYTYQNEEKTNKNKLCINININKEENKKKKMHLINFFSLFCGDIKDEDDDLSKFLKNNFKDILLEDNEIISNTMNAIKNSFLQCETKYINYFLREKIKKNKISKIQNCSIVVLLSIDDIIYLANIGNIRSLISSNFSTKIEYLTKEGITQEEYENNIKKKRKSLYSMFNYNINFANELNSSKECFNSSKLNNIHKIDSKDILNIINLNTIYSYDFIRLFPGKILDDIVLNSNKKSNIHFNKNTSNRKSAIFIPSNNNHTNRVKVNNFITDNEESNDKNDDFLKTRRASLGPFFKIAPKTQNYNPNKNYRKSCAQKDSNNKTQKIEIVSSYPDIISFKHKKNKHDFIFIGCNQIFQKITNDKICKCVYDTMKKCIKKHRSFELFLGYVIKDIIKLCISVGIKRNISCLFICFNSIKNLYLRQNIEELKKIIVPLCLTFTNHNKYEIYDELLTYSFIDVDKANNYNEIIEKNIDKIKDINGNLPDIIEENEIEKQKSDNDNNKYDSNLTNSKIKTTKKKCCCFLY